MNATEILNVLNDFESYDWPVRANPYADKGQDEYDVIIIGAGIASLGCATLLVKKGFKLLLLEHHDRVGGFAGSFIRDRFHFNNGLGEITGIWEKGPVTYLANEAQLDIDSYFTRRKAGGEYRIGDQTMPIPEDIESLVSMLTEMFPEESTNIEAFMSDAQKAQDEFYQYADEYKVPMTPELVSKAIGISEAEYRKQCPHITDWLSSSAGEKFNDHFENQALIDFLSGILVHPGADLDDIPALSMLRHYGYLKNGNYFSIGGSQRFVNALRKYIKKQGGDILLQHKVNKILVENGHAVGVKAEGKIYKSNVVVSSTHTRNTFRQLVDPVHLDQSYLSYIDNLRNAYTITMAFLGVDMDLSAYPSLIYSHGDGGDCLILIATNEDPRCAPEGKAAVVIFDKARYEDFPERETEAYAEKKRAIADSLVDRADAQIPGLRDNIIVYDAATPRTLERYNATPEGTGEGLEDSISNVKPCFKSPIKGLYQIGNSVFPGSGLELAAASGMICANDICHWEI